MWHEYWFCRLYSQTFMCVGVFESRSRQRYLLLEKARQSQLKSTMDYRNDSLLPNGIRIPQKGSQKNVGEVALVQDPCYPVGSSSSFSEYELLMPCTLSTIGKRKLRKLGKAKKTKFGKVLVNHEIKESILQQQKMASENNNTTSDIHLPSYDTSKMSPNGSTDGTRTSSPDQLAAQRRQVDRLLSNYRTVAHKLNLSSHALDPFSHVSPVAHNILKDVVRLSPWLGASAHFAPKSLGKGPPPKASWEDTRWWAAVTGSSVWSRWRRSLTGASAAAPSSTATVSSGSTCRHFLKSFWWVLSMCCHGNSAVNVLPWQQCCQCAVMATVLSMCCHGNSAVNVLSWQQWYIYTSASPDDGVL